MVEELYCEPKNEVIMGCHNEKRVPSGLPLPRPPKAKEAKKTGKTQSSSADIRKLFRRIEERRYQPSKKTVIDEL